jgi:hypothetical protein
MAFSRFAKTTAFPGKEKWNTDHTQSIILTLEKNVGYNSKVREHFLKYI